MNNAHTYIIAEAGVNHNGDERVALQLIDIAAQAGTDAVKFQLFNPDMLVTETAPTAEYQAQNLENETISQRDMLRTLTLPLEAYPRLEGHCKDKGLDFLCTPFDHGSLRYLLTHTQMKYLKLASGEVANPPLLLEAARSGLPVILSTGMSNLDEVKAALAILHWGLTHNNGYPTVAPTYTADMAKDLAGRVVVLHCVSQYPAPAEASNLNVIKTLQKELGLPIGFSDHTVGIDVSLAAVGMGAVMIEKHFTYDVGAKGPDHKASLMPQQLAEMVRAVRSGNVVKAHQEWLGDGIKRCQPVEENTKAIARRSVVAAKPIKKGDNFILENIACKRPATGEIQPEKIWELLGKTATHDYAADEFIRKVEL